MRKALCMLLIFALLLSGCGGAGEQAAAPVTEATAEATEAPTTAPTLSPEEQLYNSLPQRQKMAVDLGIVELSQLEDPERVVTVGEASAMLQKAYVHRTGVESKVLAELTSSPDYSGRNVTRGWLAAIPGLTDMELFHGDQYESYGQWLKYMEQNGKDGYAVTDDLWWTSYNRLGTGCVDYCNKLNMEDEEACRELMAADPLYCPMQEVYCYGFNAFDATNGKKVVVPDDNGDFNALQELTMAEVVESALRFYNYPNPVAIPEFVAPEDVGSYNTDIITADLLTKETELPEASSQKLPSEWHGVVMDDMAWLGEYSHLDCNVYEYEIKAVKDAGFNFIGFDLDFSWMQDYWLFKADDPLYAMVDPEDKGKFSLERLEQLDQVLAWCMKYDIHLNIRASGVGYHYNSHAQNMTMLNGTKGTKAMAELWSAIAVRYANIPNKYLSFTVLSNPVFHVRNNVLMPPIEAIQAADPDRCLMVEIYGNAPNVKELAQKGVALSYRVGEPCAILEHFDYYKWNGPGVGKFTAQELVDSFQWPYDDMDGEKLLTTGLWGGASVEQTIEAAEEYGVGFMVGDFGVNLESSANNRAWPTRRFPDEAYKAMIVDVLSAIESRGYSWCFAHWYGYFGIVHGYPAFENVTYTQLEDYPYYMDTAMQGWFKEINGVG